MKLYKYMTEDRARQFLTDGLLRYSQPSAFNDPFELNPSFDLMSKADLAALPDVPDKPGMKYLTPEAVYAMFSAVMPGMERVISKHGDQEGAYALRNNDLAQQTLDQKYGILCLTESHDDLLMWAHYGASHNGVAVQFDLGHPYFAQDDLGIGCTNPASIEYQNERPVLSHSTLHSPELLFRKSKCWSYEREWRHIKLLETADTVVQADPFPVHLFRVPHDAISGIVIGVNVVDDRRVALMKLCAESHLSHVQIFQTRLHNDEYRLETDPPIDGKYPPDYFQAKICKAR
jgi:Protein of unknown function (DUF2971)